MVIKEQLRAELFEHLEEISDPNTRASWLSEPASYTELTHIGYLVDFLFETVAINDFDEELIGLLVYDENELSLVKSFANKLLAIFDRSNQTDASVLQDIDWPELMLLAKNTLLELRTNSRH